MIREVDLVSYLPQFMQQYKEPVSALKAKEPECTTAWEAADRILYNHFISTADEYGIGRFEKMLGIRPSHEDTLETRRWQVQLKWSAMVSYTLPRLREFLISVLGGDGFLLEASDEYYLELTLFNKSDEVYRTITTTLQEWLPVNIVFCIENRVTRKRDVGLYVCATEMKYIAITAEPAKEDINFAISTMIVMDTAIYKYYKADYQPREDI